MPLEFTPCYYKMDDSGFLTYLIVNDYLSKIDFCRYREKMIGSVSDYIIAFKGEEFFADPDYEDDNYQITGKLKNMYVAEYFINKYNKLSNLGLILNNLIISFKIDDSQTNSNIAIKYEIENYQIGLSSSLFNRLAFLANSTFKSYINRNEYIKDWINVDSCNWVFHIDINYTKKERAKIYCELSLYDDDELIDSTDLSDLNNNKKLILNEFEMFFELNDVNLFNINIVLDKNHVINSNLECDFVTYEKMSSNAITIDLEKILSFDFEEQKYWCFSENCLTNSNVIIHTTNSCVNKYK